MKKVFGPAFFLQMLYLFKVGKLETFLAHGQQYSRMDLVYFVTSSQGFIHAQNKHKQRQIAFFYRMPDLCITFGGNNKSDPENGRALHRIPFFNDQCLEGVKKEKMD